MAIAVIGGLVVSTALSLVVVPTFFVTADGMAVRVRESLRLRREQKILKRAGSAS